MKDHASRRSRLSSHAAAFAAGVAAVAAAIAVAGPSAALTPSFSARDRPGPPSVEGLPRWGVGGSADQATALRIDGTDVSMAEYRRIVEAAAEVRSLLESMPESQRRRFAGALNPEEIVLVREHAEPLALARFHAPQSEALERRAWEMYERARDGEDWWALVDEYSLEPLGTRRRGDVGVVAAHHLVGPYNRLIFTAPIGRPLPPVQTVFGWHVGKVHEILPATDDEPERRRISQALLMYDSEPVTGHPVDLRHVIREVLRNDLEIDVVDRSLCDELPALCAEDERDGEVEAAPRESAEP